MKPPPAGAHHCQPRRPGSSTCPTRKHSERNYDLNLGCLDTTQAFWPVCIGILLPIEACLCCKSQQPYTLKATSTRLGYLQKGQGSWNNHSSTDHHPYQ